MNPALAPSYVAVTERPGQPASRIQLEMLAARYRWAAEQAGGKDVLEAGCGAGMGLPVLAEVALSVQAGDVDAENLRMARRACAGHTSIGLRAFRAQELPFPGDSFDLVLLFEAIYYLPDTRRFFEEARRVLRPGGALLIVTVNPEWAGFNPSPLKTRYLSAGDLLTDLRNAGFIARVQGAFAENTGGSRSAIALLRRAAVALNLIPHTMRGKALLKRIFYGRLQPVPSRLAAGSASPASALDEIDAAGSRRHRVLYATARKAIE
jgi:SAM-dependent methyltransferase